MRRLVLLATLAACPKPAVAPPTPPIGNGSGGTAASCNTDGAVIFEEKRWALHENPPANQPPGRTITIRETGAWSVDGEGATAGCLTGDELTSFQGRLGVATLVPPPEVYCQMMPGNRFEITFGGATIEYEAPCSRSPDEPSAKTIACAEDLTVSRATPSGACSQ